MSLSVRACWPVRRRSAADAARGCAPGRALLGAIAGAWGSRAVRRGARCTRQGNLAQPGDERPVAVRGRGACTGAAAVLETCRPEPGAVVAAIQAAPNGPVRSHRTGSRPTSSLAPARRGDAGDSLMIEISAFLLERMLAHLFAVPGLLPSLVPAFAAFLGPGTAPHRRPLPYRHLKSSLSCRCRPLQWRLQRTQAAVAAPRGATAGRRDCRWTGTSRPLGRLKSDTGFRTRPLPACSICWMSGRSHRRNGSTGSRSWRRGSPRPVTTCCGRRTRRARSSV